MKPIEAGYKIIYKLWKAVITVLAILFITAACAGCKDGIAQNNSADNTASNSQSEYENPDNESLQSSAEEQDKDKRQAFAERQEIQKAVIVSSIELGEKTAGQAEKQRAEAMQSEIEQSEMVQSEIEQSGTEGQTQPFSPAQSSAAKIVAIDAGHQSIANSEKEPIGPGAETMKAKVAGGTTGVATGKPEYQLTLEISLKLKQELESRGYTVVMIRETNDVNISNAERAEIANSSGATAFIRIHADGSDNSTVSGASTLCPTADNPYCSSIYAASRSLSEAVLDGLCEATGCKKRYVSEVDNMSGINWCKIPVSIVEVGFMTNPDEDLLLSTEEYQWKVAKGIADGLDKYYSEMENN